MLRVTSGRTSPRMTSMLYCAAIGTCEEEAWELARAQEWARALERWMSSLPTLFGGAFLDTAVCTVPYSSGAEASWPKLEQN